MITQEQTQVKELPPLASVEFELSKVNTKTEDKYYFNAAPGQLIAAASEIQDRLDKEHGHPFWDIVIEVSYVDPNKISYIRLVSFDRKACEFVGSSMVHVFERARS
jgi:hypothetical protein